VYELKSCHYIEFPQFDHHMQTLEELTSKVDELSAQVDEKKEAMDEKEKEHKNAMDEKEKDHKNAMDEKDDERKDAMEKEHEKHESSYKSMYSKMKANMDEEKDDKKKEGMKAVLKAMKEDHEKESKHADMDNPEKYERKGKHDYKSAEEKKKDREHEANITYLTGEIIKPKINILESLYKASKTPDAKIEEYKAEWKNQSGQQLDAEIEKMKNIVGNVTGITFEAQNSAFGFSTVKSLKHSNQFDASKVSGKVDKMTDSELFNKPPGVF